MITLETAIDKIKQLPAEQRNEVVKFVEFLEFKLSQMEYPQEQVAENEKEISFAKAAKEFMGCLDSELEDLSYNPNYILLSQADWESLVETTKWLQFPNIISDVESARSEYANNETLTMDQVFGS
jgi:hypothetical protein